MCQLDQQQKEFLILLYRYPRTVKIGKGHLTATTLRDKGMLSYVDGVVKLTAQGEEYAKKAWEEKS
jgi:hypothetical protein